MAIEHLSHAYLLIQGQGSQVVTANGVGGGSNLYLAASLRSPRETFERVYRNGPDVILAGAIAPVGTAEATAGGFRVNGRWPFASGCQHADWMAGFCVMTEGGKPELLVKNRTFLPASPR